MGEASDQPGRHSIVPLFPLPNVVLFPRAVLPLHIFEERYKTMTRDVLAGNKQLAMALLRPGWEKNYYERPEIEPIVCVGTIVSHEALRDGKFNFLLQGHTRARIVEEIGKGPYRQARVETLAETHMMEIDLSSERDRLLRLFDEGGPLSDSSIAPQFSQMLASPMPTDQIADLVAFNFIEDLAFKQSLLADTDVRRRIHRIAQSLESLPIPVDPTLN